MPPDTMQAHWNTVYDTKSPDSVSWYQATPEPSLRVLDEFDVASDAAFIDIGGGASSLVDQLILRGWIDLSVLDIAESALTTTKARLGDNAQKVQWHIADATAWQPQRRYAVWHDRAVFHFLTAPEQRDRYRRNLEAGTQSGSLIVMATFAADGPERCSGLPVQRYSAETLSAEFGTAFDLQREWREAHEKPNGATQSFQWCVFRRR